MTDWRPFEGPQENFCQRGEYEVLFGGAKGPGKTDCLIMEATRGTEYSRYKGLILRRTFPRLQEIIDRCHMWYPHFGAYYKAGEHRWYFPGGAIITLGHVQHEDSKYDYHGKEFHWMGWDELTEFFRTQYLFILANVRKASEGPDLRIRCTTNPGGVGHVWVRDRFVTIVEPGKTYIDPVTGTSRVFIPATVYDNDNIVKYDPQYIKRLEGLPEVEKRRFLYGEWGVFEGQVFTELSQRVYGADWFPIPPEWEKFMAFDWGYSRPWCALWFALDFDGTLYLYRELYGTKDAYGSPEYSPDKGKRQTNIEICRDILDAEKERIKYRVADPACWSPTKLKGSNVMHGPSFTEDAGKEGLFFLKADNDRLRGKQQIHQRLQVETEVGEDNEITKEYTKFVAFNTCKRWWDEMLELREDPKNPEDVDTDQPDEGYDCTRYGFMSRPIIPKRVHIEPQGTFAAERRKLISAKKYAIRHGVSMAAAYGRL